MILIVDDKPENIFALKKILSLNNFEVDSASSGEEALRKILKFNYHLVILDVQMPEMDGFEVAEMIVSYSKSKDTPIIFLSAINKEKKFVARGYKAGAIDYITKPVDPDILLLKVASFYAMSEQRLELKRIQQSLLTEIEHRKKTEKELSDLNQELQSVMESIPEIAFTIAKNGNVEYVNRRWDEWFSDPKNLPEPESEQTYQRWQHAFARGKEFEEEVKVRRTKKGNNRHFLLKIIPVSQHGIINKWVGSFTDIHQQKEANEYLEQKVKERASELIIKNKKLELFNEELQQVTWVLSHDLKEPVRKILTYGNLIKKDILRDDNDTAKYFQRILKSSERMSSLINDLLDFSKIPGAEGENFVETDFKTIIREVQGDLEDRIEKQNATIIVGDFPLIEAIPGQIHQLFQNLISNALKFAKPDVPSEINVTADVIDTNDAMAPASKTGGFCRITISDNGIGFDEKYLDKIFQVFQRLGNKEREGTGIGLAIVKKIVEKHSGSVTARSKTDEGATFIIVLPLKHQTKHNTNF